jgi:hypothetical protein
MVWGSILNTELWVDEHSFFPSTLFLLLSFTCGQNRWSGKGFFQRNFWEFRIQHDDMYMIVDLKVHVDIDHYKGRQGSNMRPCESFFLSSR